MKLSDIRGERVFDVVAEIIDPIVSIAQDKDAADLFAPREKPKDMEPWEFFLSRVKRSLPPLLRTHREDFVRIMAVINDVTPEEYKRELTLAKLFSDVTELVTDREFTSFFG